MNWKLKTHKITVYWIPIVKINLFSHFLVLSLFCIVAFFFFLLYQRLLLIQLPRTASSHNFSVTLHTFSYTFFYYMCYKERFLGLIQDEINNFIIDEIYNILSRRVTIPFICFFSFNIMKSCFIFFFVMYKFPLNSLKNFWSYRSSIFNQLMFIYYDLIQKNCSPQHDNKLSSSFICSIILWLELHIFIKQWYHYF